MFVEADFILPLGGRNHNLPRIYTLKVKGRQFTTMLGKPAPVPSAETEIPQAISFYQPINRRERLH
jgi:hypothetical protein